MSEKSKIDLFAGFCDLLAIGILQTMQALMHWPWYVPACIIGADILFSWSRKIRGVYK